MPEDVVQGTPALEVTPAPAPAPAASPESAPVAPAVESPSEKVPESAPAPEAMLSGNAQYTPDFKFKVMDKEMEVDPWLREVVKTKEHEEKLKELYTKAHGLDHVKPKYESERQSREKLETDFSGFKEEVSSILGLRDQGLQNPIDMGDFLQSVGVTDEAVAKYLLAKHQLSELPEETQRLYNESKAAKAQIAERDQKIQDGEKRWQQAAGQARQAELESVLARADVNQYTKNYDEAMKRPGAFRDLVRRHAIAEHYSTGIDLSAEAATTAVMNLLGEVYRAKPAPVQPQGVPQKDLPVLPHVGGKSISPIERIPRSIEDLKKMGRELGAR